MSRMLVAVLGVLAAVALVVVQFLPWGGTEDFGFRMDAYTWKAEMSGEFGGFDFSNKENWYTGDFEGEGDEGMEIDDSDLLKVRIAIPLLSAGLLLAAVAGLLAFMSRGPAALLLLIGGILAAAGTVLFALAVDHMFDSDQDWGAAFYIAIAASAMALIGGIVGLAGGNRGASS